MKPCTTFVGGKNPWNMHIAAPTAREAVLDVLAIRPKMTIGALIAVTGLANGTVRAAIQRGLCNGQIKRIAHGTYAINQVAA